MIDNNDVDDLIHGDDDDVDNAGDADGDYNDDDSLQRTTSDALVYTTYKTFRNNSPEGIVSHIYLQINVTFM